MILATWSSQPSRETGEESDHTIKLSSKAHLISSARPMGRLRENLLEKVTLKLNLKQELQGRKSK